MYIIYTNFKENAPSYPSLLFIISSLFSFSLSPPSFPLLLPPPIFLPSSFLFSPLGLFEPSACKNLEALLRMLSADGPLHSALSSLMLLQGRLLGEAAMVVGPEAGVSGWPLGRLA